MFLKLRRIMRF